MAAQSWQGWSPRLSHTTVTAQCQGLTVHLARFCLLGRSVRIGQALKRIDFKLRNRETICKQPIMIVPGTNPHKAKPVDEAR